MFAMVAEGYKFRYYALFVFYKRFINMTNVIKPSQLLIAFVSLFVFLGGCNAQESKAAEKPTEPTTSGEKKKMSANPVIKIETSKGTMMLELDAEKAPNSAANFVAYVEDGFYDGLIFHRVIPGFMVQGGGMNPDMSEKGNKKAPIKNEANNGLKNDRGTIAMARTGDPHSASSQFFFNLKDNDFLNHTSESQAGWGYAVFGKLIDGLDVIDEIEKVKTGNHGGHADVPLEAVTITKMSVVK